MEDYRYVRFFVTIFLLGTFLMFPFFIYAYSDKTTHPALAQETVKFFNHHFQDLALGGDALNLLMQGSIDEDHGTRPLQHFYDPVHDKGLTLAGKVFQASKRWAQDTVAQAKYRSNTLANPYSGPLYGSLKSRYVSDTDHSWERAIYEYAWGDRDYALYSLGHIIHLVQDASVPDHTRDDPHPPILDFGSPYEFWSKKWSPDNITTYTQLVAENKSVIVLQTLEEHFFEMASYSNNNFFSKDTIFIDKYITPAVYYEKNEVSEDGKYILFGYTKTSQNDQFKVVGRLDSFAWQDIGAQEFSNYFINDPDNLILSAYWDRLSKRAVQHGAGVIKLFFDEVEKEKENKTLYNKNKNWFTKAKDFIAGKVAAFGTSSLQVASVTKIENIGEESDIETQLTQSADAQEGSNVTTTPEQTLNSGAENNATQEDNANSEEQETVSVENNTRISTNTETTSVPQDEDRQAEAVIQESDIPAQAPYIPGFGGGGGVHVHGEGAKLVGGSDPPTSEENGNTGTSTPNTTATTTPGGADSTSNTNVTTTPDNADTTTPNGDNGENETEDNDNDDENDNNSVSETDTTPPEVPVIIFPATTTAFFTNPTVTFLGTAEASSTISVSYEYEGDNSYASSTAAQDNNWELELTLQQGTTTVMFTATDEAGNTSSTTEHTVFIDSISPSLYFGSQQCNNGESACVTSTSTISAEWYSTSSDLAFYNFSYNTAFSTTTATSTNIIATNDNTHTFEISAEDIYGNLSATSTISITVYTKPVVINEIAWMGTQASSADEWIELYNTTDQAFSLEDWSLYSETDNSPNIALEGTIPAGGYYLIERKNGGESNETTESPVTDVTADLWTSFGVGLNNGGEVLVLKDNTGAELDRVSLCGSNWCGGSSSGVKPTMERFRWRDAGTDNNNWGTNNASIRNGDDINGSPVYGTPKARNSFSYQIGLNSTIFSNTNLALEYSPYIIFSDNIVPQNVTLTIEPGVVIKLSSDTSLSISGALITTGTTNSPVVFTSIYDDTHAGDTNGDGICDADNASSTAICPSAGDWNRVYINSSNLPSSFQNTEIHYGGSDILGNPLPGALAIGTETFTASNLSVTNSLAHGVYVKNGSADISSSSFSNNGLTTGSSGVYLEGGASYISQSSFDTNAFGIRLEYAPSVQITNNTFTNNTADAMFAYGAIPRIENNTGNNNGVNAITVGNTTPLTISNSTSTLYTNALPYLIRNTGRVVANSTLNFENGVIIKGDTADQGGLGKIIVEKDSHVIYNGESSTDLIFTSRNDDSVGGATDANPAAPEAGDWGGFSVHKEGELNLSGITMKYAGGGSGDVGGFVFGYGIGPTSTISRAVVEKNIYGVYIRPDRVLKLDDVLFKGHNDALYVLGWADLHLTNVSFEGNSTDIRGIGAGYEFFADDATKSSTPTTVPIGLLD